MKIKCPYCGETQDSENFAEDMYREGPCPSCLRVYCYNGLGQSYEPEVQIAIRRRTNLCLAACEGVHNEKLAPGILARLLEEGGSK